MSYRNPHLKGLSKYPLTQRLKARWWNLRNNGKSLNRRVAVENYLWDIFQKKRPTSISREEAKALALHLGVPQDTMTLKDRLDAIP